MKWINYDKLMNDINEVIAEAFQEGDINLVVTLSLFRTIIDQYTEIKEEEND